MRLRALLAAILLLAAGAAQAQLRSIPEDAKRGEMRHLQETVVELDGNAVRLAPSAQIRDQSNRIVLPSTLVQTVLVKYLADPQGLPVRIWILTPAEAAQPDRAR